MLQCLCFFALIFGVSSTLAPFITPCKLGDTTCMLSSARAAATVLVPGLPALKVEPIDPLNLPLIKGDQGGLQLTLKNTTLTGLKDCVIENTKNNLDKGKMAYTTRCSPILRGDYTAGGQLFLFPITGEGKYTIDIKDIVIKTMSEVATVQGEDGKPHWHINKWRHVYQTKGGAKFHFENLFNGNQVLAQPIEGFLNTNWPDVMKEVAPPIVEAIVSAIIDRVQALFKAVPAEELYTS